MGLVVVDYINILFLTLLIVVSLAVSFIKDLLYVTIIYGVFSLLMALLWLQMNSPDIAITEAAAGIGMTTLMVAVISHTSRKEE